MSVRDEKLLGEYFVLSKYIFNIYKNIVHIKYEYVALCAEKH